MKKYETQGTKKRSDETKGLGNWALLKISKSASFAGDDQDRDEGDVNAKGHFRGRSGRQGPIEKLARGKGEERWENITGSRGQATPRRKTKKMGSVVKKDTNTERAKRVQATSLQLRRGRHSTNLKKRT